MFDLRLEGALARLKLARPEVRNAVPASGWDSLAALLDEAEGKGARLIVISGEGGAFCAGADLGDFAELAGDEAAAGEFRRAMRRGLDRLGALVVPSIALIDGACYGAGVALAAACDIRLAGPDARFAVTPAKMGISFPQEDLHRLVRLVGPGQAARLLFGGEAIGAREAIRIGLADGDSGEIDVLSAAILANDSESLGTLKRGIALAAAGVRSDVGQDRRFDRLLASEGLARRLEARRRR